MKKLDEEMKKKKFNKLITILFIINIAIIMIIIGLALYYSRYTADDVIELYLKNARTCNYKATIIIEDYRNPDEYEDIYIEPKSERTVIAKEGLVKENDNGNIKWHLMNKVIAENKKLIGLHENDEMIYSDSVLRWYLGEVYSTLSYIIQSEDYKFRFIKEEKLNGVDCIVVEYKSQYEDFGISKSRYWIDKKDGLFLREEELNSKNELIRLTTYDIQLNCVTDEDLILPDTSGYKVIDQRNNS